MIRASVIGATGYAGMELIRLLARHPGVTLVEAASESYAGQSLSQVYPHLGIWGDFPLGSPDPVRLAERSDVVFLALPHGLAMNMAPRCLEAGARVIDLGADFRLRDGTVYKQWYGLEHASTDLLGEAVYGLPELWRDEVRGARLVANPGCYPTASILGLAPLLAAGWVEPDGLVIDAKSGVSGAGRGVSLKVHFAEVNENLRPYGIGGAHRHTPEIEQALSRVAGAPLMVSFNPHLAPMNRGILATIYGRLREHRSAEEITGLYRTYYEGEPFMRVLEPGRLPETKHAQGSNNCLIGAAVDARTGRVVVVAALDNLVKGAAGQAVQNMNIMFGLEETAGLDAPALYP